MMCPEVEPLLAPAADGLLDAARRAQLDAHLAECDGCRAALEDQRQVASILASTVAPDVSQAFLVAVNGRIDASDDLLESVDFRWWTLRLAPIAAVLALVAYLGIGARATTITQTSTQAAATFSPKDSSDWERDVTANALLEAALKPTDGDKHVR